MRHLSLISRNHQTTILAHLNPCSSPPPNPASPLPLPPPPCLLVANSKLLNAESIALLHSTKPCGFRLPLGKKTKLLQDCACSPAVSGPVTFCVFHFQGFHSSVPYMHSQHLGQCLAYSKCSADVLQKVINSLLPPYSSHRHSLKMSLSPSQPFCVQHFDHQQFRCSTGRLFLWFYTITPMAGKASALSKYSVPRKPSARISSNTISQKPRCPASLRPSITRMSLPDYVLCFVFKTPNSISCTSSSLKSLFRALLQKSRAGQLPSCVLSVHLNYIRCRTRNLLFLFVFSFNF